MLLTPNRRQILPSILTATLLPRPLPQPTLSLFFPFLLTY